MVGVLVAVGFGVVVPVLPIFAREFGASTFMVGAVVSSFAFLKLLTNPFAGPIIERLGGRVTLGVGILIVAASSAGCGFASNYLQLLVLRGLGGIGSALFSVGGLTLLLAATDTTNRGRASALYSGSFLIGNMAGPAVGAALVGISIRAPFFFYALTLTAAATVGLAMLRGPDAHESDRQQVGPVPRQVWHDRRYQAACLANFTAGWQAYGARSTLVPILMVETLGKPTSWTGIAFAIAAVAQAIALAPVGRIVDNVGRKPVLISGLVICAVSGALLAFSPDAVWLTVLLCIFGVGASMLATAPTAIVGEVAGSRGTPVAVFQAFSDLGNIIGPMVAGAIVDAASMPLAFGLGSTLMALVAVFALGTPTGKETA